MRTFFLLIIISSFQSAKSQKKIAVNKDKIILVIKAPTFYNQDVMEVRYRPLDGVVLDNRLMSIRKQKISFGCARFEFDSDKPLRIIYEATREDSKDVIYVSRFYEPGDSVYIEFKERKPVFTGRGVGKYHLIDEYLEKCGTITRPNDKIDTYRDFLRYMQYADKLSTVASDLLAGYKSKISSLAYDYFKLEFTANIEKNRWTKFNDLTYRKIMDISSRELTHIFDSMANADATRKLLNPERNNPLHIYSNGLMEFYHTYLRSLFLRNIDFNLQSGVASIHANRATKYYDLAKQSLKGLYLEEFLVYFMDVEMHEYGFPPHVEELLIEFYNRPGSLHYWDYFREREVLWRKGFVKVGNGKSKHELTLINEKGKKFSTYSLKGKIVLVNFWRSGSKYAEQLVPIWQRLQDIFKGDSNVVFLNVSCDDYYSTWKTGIREEKYVTGSGMHFFAGGFESDPKPLKDYGIMSYPTISGWDHMGTIIITDPMPDLSTDPLPAILQDGGTAVIEKIRKALSERKKYLAENPELFDNAFAITDFDGPYVLYDNDSVRSYSIIRSELDVKIFSTKKPSVLQASTDKADMMFSFPLRNTHSVEPCFYPRPDKMLVLSDIEGNFKAFRKLLQSNKVIDEDFNWIFGNGHLVFGGDMFDRGEQVTECLWLIYALEDKAKAAGGYVHFVLGNHEIMNLSGKTSYVQYKYKLNAQRMNKSYRELYNEGSELGRWLRTKNIVEKIGDLLFLHGGISPHVNELPLTIEQINEAARPFYANSDSANNSGNSTVKTLYHSYKSPFWYRHYYYPDHYSKSKKEFFYHATKGQLDSTCYKFDVNRIVTGHTIIADTISIHHGGRVINTDTKHAVGKSEALLIEGDKFYRVNGEAKKVLLFIDDKKKHLISPQSTSTNSITE